MQQRRFGNSVGVHLLGLVMVMSLAVPQALAEAVDETPDPFAMVGDLVVARPIGLVMTAAGAAAFIVSLPFTAMAGHVSEAAETLVIGPAETTFVRCLGCRNSGYTYKDKELRDARKNAD